ncbi:MAG: hypothetical protein K6A23_02495 [Butyrivibrio sp.]|nr:hypothetical protein [Butyrivibrio sp.]
MSYQSNAERAQDNHSSGAMLVIVGIIGVILDIIIFTLNPFNVPEFNRFLSCGVMLALFILFIVMGVLSLKTYKILIKKVAEESNLKEELSKWCDQNLSKEKIDVAIYEQEHINEGVTDSQELTVTEDFAKTLVKETSEEVEVAGDLSTAEDANSELSTDTAVDSIDEALYFARTEAIKKIINQNFINLDEEVLDSFIDEFYSKIYENQEIQKD